MNVLAFDTCFDACSVAVALDAEASRCTLEERFELRDKGHAEALMPMIEETLASAGIGLSGIDRIAVTTGPGTFTGTRIGIAAARALALATGKEIVGASSLAVMAHGLPASLAEPRGRTGLTIAVDARRGQVYVQLFGSDGFDARSVPELLTIEDAAMIGGPGPVALAGSGAALVEEEARRRGREVAVVISELHPRASALARMAPRLVPAPGPLRPLYLRPPDARPQEGKSLPRT
jgi:tRNA threonylcarbamoyladenosine biosynthesis protein TsaB